MNAPARQDHRAPELVIVPLDGSVLATAALVPAVALAGLLGASIELLTTRWDDALDRPQRYLDTKAARLAVDRVETTVDSHRNAPQAILHAACRPGAVVCMTTHGRSRIREGLVGSVAGDVLRRSSRPMLLVGPNALTRLSGFEPATMGIALDGSKRSETIVPVAIEWAADLAMTPWLLQVVDPDPDVPPDSDAVESGYLDTLTRRIRGQGEIEWDVLHGDDPADALVDHAKTMPMSLLALTSHGRSGSAQVALGSVALRLAHHSPCPLLVTGPRCS